MEEYNMGWAARAEQVKLHINQFFGIKHIQWK